jgi:hypothetical protein
MNNLFENIKRMEYLEEMREWRFCMNKIDEFFFLMNVGGC